MEKVGRGGGILSFHTEVKDKTNFYQSLFLSIMMKRPHNPLNPRNQIDQKKRMTKTEL